MKTKKLAPDPQTTKTSISTLWVFVVINILAADIFSFLLQGASSEAPIAVTQQILLVFAILLEIPIAMIFLSRILPRRSNRIVNIIAGIVTIAYVIGGGSNTLHYLFFAALEVLAMVFIILQAWAWKDTTKSAAVPAQE